MQRTARLTSMCAAGGLGALAVLALGASLALTGCGESDAASGGITSPAATADATLASGPPTLDELRTRLQLSTRQAEEIEPPLGDWRIRHETQARQLRSGEGLGAGSGASPMLEFLASSSEILTREQFLELAAFLTERREAQADRIRARFRDGPPEDGRGPAARGGGRWGGPERGGLGRNGPGMGGPGRGGPRGDGPGGDLRDLGVTREQAQALREANREYRKARAELVKSYHEDAIGAEALRSGLEDLESSHEAKLASLLDDTQLATLTGKKEARRTERAQRRLENLGNGIDERVAFLTKVLALDESQAASVRAALENAVAEETAILTALLAGTLSPVDAFVDGLLVREAAREAIEAVLTPGQIEVLEALRPLMPGPGGRRHA